MEHNINIDDGSYEYLYNNSNLDERMLLIEAIKNSNIDLFKNTHIYKALEQRKKLANILYKSQDLTNKTYEYQVMFNELNNSIKQYFILYNL